MPKFALYACPTGELADHIQAFLAHSQATLGTNAAHDQLPACSLIDWFEEKASAAPIYTQSLDRAYNRGVRSRPTPVLHLHGLLTTADGLTLALASPWLRQLMVNFACTVKSPTRKTPLHIQDPLHITLAQGFPEDQRSTLIPMAEAMIPLNGPSHWEMRFYQHAPGPSWILHQGWELGVGERIQAEV